MRRQEEEEEDCIAVVRSETKAEQRTDISLSPYICIQLYLNIHVCYVCMYICASINTFSNN